MIITRSLVVEHSLTRMESLGMGIEIQTFRSDFETDFPGLGVECCFLGREKRLKKVVSEFQLRTNNGHTCKIRVKPELKESFLVANRCSRP